MLDTEHPARAGAADPTRPWLPRIASGSEDQLLAEAGLETDGGLASFESWL
jgi:hypothetical protein